MKYLRKVINGLNHLRLNLFCKNIKLDGVGLVATSSIIKVIKGQLKAGKRVLLSKHTELRSHFTEMYRIKTSIYERVQNQDVI